MSYLLECSGPDEHLLADCNIIVRENEPSSIIAYTLSTKEYIQKMQAAFNLDGEFTNDTKLKTMNGDEAKEFDRGVLEEILQNSSGTHVKYQFSDTSTKMYCKIFFADQFEALREVCAFQEGYIESLARCCNWEATGGKSGSTFLKTRDDRLIIKQLSKFEVDSLLKFAPIYFQYMSEAIFHKLPTSLVKIFGFYRLGFKNSSTGKSMKMDVMVMENLFYGQQIERIFDLKGSMRNRLVQSTGAQNQVLLDENLIQFMYESPLFINEPSRQLLRASVWNDTLFLSKLDIMDYSLLVGINEKTNKLVVGIVDFVRTYTWDKKLESWVKESGILGGGGKEPTIISPKQYKERFREAMEKYFLEVSSLLIHLYAFIYQP